MNEISIEAGLASESRPSVVRALLADFAATAVDRDARGGTAKRERDLIRASGLLRLTIPRELGGAGSDVNEALTITRQIAGVDPSLAHLLAFHHLMLATVRLFGPAEQWMPLFERTAQEGWFWGNALNPLDQRTRIEPAGSPGAYRVTGTKSFCSGASDSDMLIVSALRPGEPGLVVAAVPTLREGIRVHDDWDCIGQRQTDSGTVTFDQVIVHDHEILRNPGPLGSPFASLRTCIAQLVLVNIYLGIAEGALAEAARYVSQAVRPWMTAGVERIEEDPYTLRNFGDYWVEAAAAGALADRAQQRLQRALDLGDSVDTGFRAEVAVDIAAAKVASARAALNISSRIFEVLGARATAARLRLDRFWRNARTHTLHDPLDYKLRELGSWALARKPPTPSSYS